MSTIKKIVMTGPKASEVIEVPMPVCGDNELLIRNKYMGVCMSEHYFWSTAEAGAAFGHEPLGTIEAVGKNVKGYAVGDKVSGHWWGGMAEYAVADLSRDFVYKLPDNVRDEDLVLEPLACLVSAVSKARIRVPGDTVCVVGAGYMGCGAIGLLKARGAKVVAVDIRKESLADAKRYGADEIYLVDEALAKFVNSDHPGFDCVMEWGESNESLDLAINLTAECGQLCVGAYHTGGKRLVDIQQLNVKAIECLSTHPREVDLLNKSVQRAAEMLSNGTWNYVNVPVKIYPMDKFSQAHADMETKYGTYMKALVDLTKETGEPYVI